MVECMTTWKPQGLLIKSACIRQNIGKYRFGIVVLPVLGGAFMDYKISYIGDDNINNVHHIEVNYNRDYYRFLEGM